MVSVSVEVNSDVSQPLYSESWQITCKLLTWNSSWSVVSSWTVHKTTGSFAMQHVLWQISRVTIRGRTWSTVFLGTVTVSIIFDKLRSELRKWGNQETFASAPGGILETAGDRSEMIRCKPASWLNTCAAKNISKCKFCTTHGCCVCVPPHLKGTSAALVICSTAKVSQPFSTSAQSQPRFRRCKQHG